jgi:hypothetical protein
MATAEVVNDVQNVDDDENNNDVAEEQAGAELEGGGGEGEQDQEVVAADSVPETEESSESEVDDDEDRIEEEEDEDEDSIRTENEAEEEPLLVSAVPEMVRPLRDVRREMQVYRGNGGCGNSGRNAHHGGGGGGTDDGEGLHLSRHSRLLRTLRKSGRRILLEPFERLYDLCDNSTPPCDILSITIHCQMWHVTDRYRNLPIN